MMSRNSRRVLGVAMLAAIVPALAVAQDATTARDAMRARREARREANASAQNPDERNKALAERMRVEGSLREALAQAVKQRLNLNDQQATRLMDVNRKFGEDRHAYVFAI